MCRRIVTDCVIIKDGKILLIKRGHEPFKGMWAIPGGRLEDDETVEECCLREAKEEIGVDVKIARLVGVYSNPKLEPEKFVVIAFLCDIKDDTKVKAGSDAVEFKWVDLEDVKNMKLAADHKKIIEDALSLIDID